MTIAAQTPSTYHTLLASSAAVQWVGFRVRENLRTRLPRVNLFDNKPPHDTPRLVKRPKRAVEPVAALHF